MKSTLIRKKFFDFFAKHNHTSVPSSSLIPAQDPTLLFTNAGMNQFKDVFLGKEQRTYKRAVSIQKCMRAGGKHNDLENVGFTKRHLTFFEMMGNFSFGDYFKREAIRFAWDFLTKEIGLDVSKLHATVYLTDDESYDIWHKEIGIPTERIHKLGAEYNFWQMGDMGPCGPCSEIHIDRGPEFGCAQCDPSCDCDRFLEIWNLVFMQFDRQSDGTDLPLKQTGVDTGMGLERLCSIVQNVDSVFQTDVFASIIKDIESHTGLVYAQQSPELKAAFHVLCDHVRAVTMLIADGCAPSNEGRGYVLRKVIRRAALFSQKLAQASNRDMQKNFFPELSKVVIKEMGSVYPDIITNQTLIYNILESEVEKFAANLVRGQQLLAKVFAQATNNLVTGEQTFKLYDTYGFPIELTKLIAQEHHFSVDEQGFKEEMAKQQAQSGKKKEDTVHVALDESVTTEFTGYQELETESEIIALIQENKLVNQVDAGDECWVITRKSPFFIVGGGQVPDQGWLTMHQATTPIIEVAYIKNAIGARIKTPTSITIGDAVISTVNKELRINAMKNHTATHLLQAALITLFGNTIKQSGSLVAPDYLRFDFTYHTNVHNEDIKRVEQLVNEKIRENIAVNIEYLPLPQAIKRGALAFFGEKYNPEHVRMVEIPGFSVELCGGTHVPRTGDIGCFKITEVSALSAGHRRITAITGPRALELYQECFDITKALSTEFKVKREDIVTTVDKQREQIKALQHTIKLLKKDFWKTQLPTWLEEVETINQIPFGFIALENYSTEELKGIAQEMLDKKPGFYFLISTDDQRCNFYVGTAAHFANSINLKKFGTWLQETHQLRGGGKDTSLQGGGVKFDAKLAASIKEWLQKTAPR